MKNLIRATALLGAFASALVSNTAHASPGFVTNGDNDGPGSLRSALESGARVIRISEQVSTITITESLESANTRHLKIIGRGQTIDASALTGTSDILALTQGADLSVSNLTFVGGFDEVNQTPETPTGGKGIYVNVPVTRTGVVRVRLDSVSVLRVGNHGVHVSDCSLGDDCGGGSGGGGEGSPASVSVRLNNVLINGVGFGRADADGVRVDDRGDGDIYFSAYNSTFINVGADGVELDEGNNGDVIADVRNSLFDSNGEYCNLVPFVAGSPCDDDGDADVDDGFDIDEAGAGSLFARIAETRVTNNFDEGLDFDEEDEDGISVRLVNVYAGDNEDEGVKMSEEGEGNVRVSLRGVTTIANNGSKEGIELEEADAGNVKVVVTNSALIGGDDEALKVEQGDEGSGILKVRDSKIGAFDLDGVEQI